MGEKHMKQYIIKYKVFSLKWWYEFSCYAENTQEAINTFIRENTLIGIEKFYIANTLKI